MKYYSSAFEAGTSDRFFTLFEGQLRKWTSPFVLRMASVGGSANRHALIRLNCHSGSIISFVQVRQNSGICPAITSALTEVPTERTSKEPFSTDQMKFENWRPSSLPVGADWRQLSNCPTAKRTRLLKLHRQTMWFSIYTGAL